MTDPHDHDHDHVNDDTRVVERERVVERPVEPAPVAGSSNVNVSGQGGYVTADPGPLYYTRRVVSLIFSILGVLLGLRIILLLLGANAGNALVDFIYGVTEPFVAPFRGVFSLDQVTPNGVSVLDVSALVALVGWALIYLLIMAILRIADRDRVAVA